MSWLDDYDGVVKQGVMDIEIPMADLRRFYQEALKMERVRAVYGKCGFGDSIYKLVRSTREIIEADK